MRLLLDRGWAFAALPSHDAQSIGGILSTDVHGTGRDWGFVSEAVARLKLIDANGTVHTCEPKDDLFRAAIGGIGAVGVISEVTVQAVPKFNVRTEIRTVEPGLRRRAISMATREKRTSKSLPVSLYQQMPDQHLELSQQAEVFSSTMREFIAISLDAWLAPHDRQLHGLQRTAAEVIELQSRVEKGHRPGNERATKHSTERFTIYIRSWNSLFRSTTDSRSLNDT